MKLQLQDVKCVARSTRTLHLLSRLCTVHACDNRFEGLCPQVGCAWNPESWLLSHVHREKVLHRDFRSRAIYRHFNFPLEPYEG